MNAPSRFVREGFLDAERRVARLTSSQPVDEPRVVALFEASAAFAFINRAVNHTVRAYESSTLITVAAGVIQRGWTARSWQSHRFSVGVVLVVATVTNVGLQLMQQSPVGWLWFLLPGMAGLLGGLSIAASGAVVGRTRD